MARGETRNRLLDEGHRLFLEQGYNHAGIEAILQASGVPKGSFYNYFASKEVFALAVVDKFAACHDAELDRALGDRSRPPMDRLRAYFENAIERIDRDGCRKGCLAGNLGQEMADQSEVIRTRLESVFSGWVDRLASCLAEARDSGAIPQGMDIQAVAEFWMNSWQGAILRAKTARSVEPLRLFLRQTLPG